MLQAEPSIALIRNARAGIAALEAEATTQGGLTGPIAAERASRLNGVATQWRTALVQYEATALSRLTAAIANLATTYATTWSTVPADTKNWAWGYVNAFIDGSSRVHTLPNLHG
jgi:hypothetical protein